MSQRIFSLNLPVETTSAYLALCGLAEENGSVNTDSIRSVWNSSDESLEKSLNELESLNIIRMTAGESGLKYVINDDKDWNI